VQRHVVRPDPHAPGRDSRQESSAASIVATHGRGCVTRPATLAPGPGTRGGSPTKRRRAGGPPAALSRCAAPETVRLLLVAEAPPASLDRYFYFTDVRAHDSLFRHIASEILRQEPSRENKAELLRLLRDAGVFLIDLRLDPTDGSALAGHVPSLIRRVRRLQPHKIVLIKATVYDAAYRLYE
jgi:hypothetical protein